MAEPRGGSGGYIRFIASKGYAGVANYADRVLALAPPMEELIRAFDLIASGAGTAGSGASANASGPAAVPAQPARADVSSEPALAPEEARPSRSEIGERVAELIPPSEEPQFKSLAHVNHKFRDARSGGVEGAIIHYDAGRTRPSNGPEDPEWGAMRTLEASARRLRLRDRIARRHDLFADQWIGKWGSHAGDANALAQDEIGSADIMWGSR